MILYFSGTGNSLYVARSLAQTLDENLCHINNAPADLTQEKVVGLVYPVYTYDAPAAVKTFTDTLVLNKDAYVFVIATCGSTPGNAILSVKQRVEKKGASLAYSRIVSMPDCSAPAMNNNPNDQLNKLEAPRNYNRTGQTGQALGKLDKTRGFRTSFWDRVRFHWPLCASV